MGFNSAFKGLTALFYIFTYLPQRHMEGAEVGIHSFLTSALDVGEW